MRDFQVQMTRTQIAAAEREGGRTGAGGDSREHPGGQSQGALAAGVGSARGVRRLSVGSASGRRGWDCAPTTRAW